MTNVVYPDWSLVLGHLLVIGAWSLDIPTMSDLPFEVQEFERLLTKPNSDATGFAGYFNSGEIWVTRVPARLDVMGGIADYSGSNVCEAVLGRGVLIGLQGRTDA